MFEEIAKDYGVVIIVPIYERAKNRSGKWEYHNSAAVIDHRGKLLDTYRKIHIPQDPGFYEKDYFKQSDSGYKIYKTKFATFAVLICYDQWYPEAAQAVRLSGRRLFFTRRLWATLLATNPKATGTTPGKPICAATPSPTACTWWP